MSTQCLRCSNSSPRARLSFSPRLIKHMGISGLPHLALGGLEAPPPSRGPGQGTATPSLLQETPMSLQTVTQPDPNSCFFLLLAPFPTHVGTSPSGKEIHSKLT